MRAGFRNALTLMPVLAATVGLAGAEDVPVRPEIPASPGIVARGASLRLGHTEVARFGRSVGTVIVGDSGILDVTAVNDRTVVLTALSAGSTNVVVLDEDADVMSRLNVRVGEPREPRSTVFRGRERAVLVCNPDCVPVGEARGTLADDAGARPVAAEPAGPADDGAATAGPSETEPAEPAE